MPKKAIFYGAVLLALISTCSSGDFASRALAQPARVDPATQKSPSHRLLPLPADGTEDLLQQFRMLQHLQDLVAQKELVEEPANNPARDGINPQLLERIRSMLPAEQQKMLDMAQEQLSDLDGMDAKSKSELKSAFEKLSSDPESVQATAEELLRQFHQTRQLPFTPRGNRFKAGVNPVAPSKSPIEDSTLASEPTRSPSRLPTPQAGQTPSLPKHSQELRPSNRRISNRSIPDRQPSAPRDSSQTSGLNKAQSGNQPSLNLGSSAPHEDNAAQGPLSLDQTINNALGKNENPAQADLLKIPTVPALLKQAKEDPASLPSLKFPENSLNMDQIKKFLAERFSNLQKDKDPWLDSLKKRLPTSFKAELHKAGLHQSLSRVMDDIKKGNQKPSDESQTSNRQFELDPRNKESMGVTLSSIKKDLEELSKTMNSAGNETANPVQPQVATSQTGAVEQAKGEKSAAGFFKRATGMFNHWMPNSKKQDSPSSAESTAANSQASSGGLQGLLAMGLCVGLLVGAFWYLSRWKPKPSVVHFDGAASLAISTRADIVQAFHLMVSASGMSIEQWWTHRRTASEISRLKPATEYNLELLSGLYEIARYSPADYQLTEEQIQQARRALEQIATC